MITTIKVRSADGKQTLVVKLHADDTLCRLYEVVEEHRWARAPRAHTHTHARTHAHTRHSTVPFTLRQMFPRCALERDAHTTLESAGLVPLATVAVVVS